MASLLDKDQSKSNNQEQNYEASQQFKFTNIHIDRQYTEDEVVSRRQSNFSQSQIPISLTPIVKQMNFFRKIQINDEDFNESAYYISAHQQTDTFKVNSNKVSKRCLSPQEKLKQALYETSLNNQFKEQSIKKYTRRKSCQGGVFGEPSSQMTIREKQFPLGIIVQHIITIIDENEKRKKQKELIALKYQKKSNLNSKIPKNPSFKLCSGKSIFNSQSSFTNQQFTAFQNNQTHQQQNFQTFQQQNSQQHKFNFFGTENHDRKSQNLNQFGSVFSPRSSNNTNKVNNNTEQINSQFPTHPQQLQTAYLFQGNESFQEINKIQQSSCQEDVNESIQISKLEIDTLNQFKLEQEDKRVNNQSIFEEDDQCLNQIDKGKKQNLQQQGSGQKYNGQESTSSNSSLELDDNDENQICENQKRTNNNQQMSYKKNLSERYSLSKDPNQEEKNNNSINEFKNNGNSQLNINFGRNSQRFSVINALAPTLHQQILKKQYSKVQNQSQNDQLQAFMSKYNEGLTKKGSFLISNVKKIQESKQLQDVLSEYLEPGSTDKLCFSPSNPSNRTENLKKAFISATNMITLQNKVKGNKSFLINYYKLIGKLTIDTNLQYLSQFADDILATPVKKHKQKSLIVCAPKKRKVFIYNTPEDKVKLISQLDKLHLNQKVQKYIHEKQTNQITQNTSKDTMTGRERAQTSFKSYFYQEKDYEFTNNNFKYTPELKPNSPPIKPNSSTNKYKFLLKDSLSPTSQYHSYLQDNINKNRSKSQKNYQMGDNVLKKLLNNEEYYHHEDFSSKNFSSKNFFSLSQKNSLTFHDKFYNTASSNSIYFTKAPFNPYLASLSPQCQNSPKGSLLPTSPRNNIKTIQNMNQHNLEQSPILSILNKQHQKKKIQNNQNS
ncbi:hypothetical protein ABPG72_012459 [Tetrahymena utriculariae]